MMEKDQSVVDLVQLMEEEDQQGNTVISKYVNFSLRETIEKVDAYLNSKHTSGDKDSLGRDKPFFNIVTASSNIRYRATDIDRKNIKLKATKKSDYTMAFIMSILLQDYMKKSYFGMFLNDWGRILARYGSAIVKFVEKDGELITNVIPWNRMIVDPIDFDNNVRIEKLWLTPAQLRANESYDQAMVEDLIESRQARENMDGEKIDNKSDYVEVYEVHGMLPLSLLTDRENDEKTDTQQMHVVSFIPRKDGSAGDKKNDEFTLYQGKEKKDPYMITHLIKEDGRTLSIGAVEHLFESQWMVNHNVKEIKDHLDLASKLIFQTSDGNFVGQNALTSIETGDILIHEHTKPLTEVNNRSHDIVALQSYGAQWKALGSEINNISESMMGVNPPSGTAWRQTQALLQESHSLFELMTENKGLHIEEMMREYIIPYLEKQMDNKEEISTILEEYQINKIDSMYIPAEATRRVNDRIKKDILNKTPEDLQNGNLFTPEQQQEQIAGEQEAIKNVLNTFDNQRFIKPSDIDGVTWKKALKDFTWEVEVDVTGEGKDTEAILTTLTTVLQTIAGNPAILQDPNAKMIFNKILAETGALSPVEIAGANSAPQPALPPQPGQEPLQQLTK